MFQSPQWGDNSKVEELEKEMEFDLFQSPQWGDNSKGNGNFEESLEIDVRFSPRNGEIILKSLTQFLDRAREGFSPRNGEIILKLSVFGGQNKATVSVPAMGR